MPKKPGEAYDPSRKGKGGPYGPKIPGGGTNPFMIPIKKAKAKKKKKKRTA